MNTVTQIDIEPLIIKPEFYIGQEFWYMDNKRPILIILCSYFVNVSSEKGDMKEIFNPERRNWFKDLFQNSILGKKAANQVYQYNYAYYGYSELRTNNPEQIVRYKTGDLHGLIKEDGIYFSHERHKCYNSREEVILSL